MSEKLLAQKCINTISKDAFFDHYLGMEILDIDVGYSKLKMVIKEFMLNGHGTCQGGAIFAFADSAFAYACNGRDVPTVAYSCDITYVRPATTGDVLIATAREVNLLKRNGIYNIEVKNQNDELVAFFVGKSRAVNGTILKEQ